MTSQSLSRKRKASTLMAGALPAAALTVAAMPAASAQAATHPVHHKAMIGRAGADALVTWQDKHDNRYLEIYHSGRASGNWADAYPGNGTLTQHWIAVSSGYSYYGGTLWGMEPENSGLCLAETSSNYGAHIVQESCGHGSYRYRWGEVSAYSHGTFEGWILAGNDGRAACENETNHWVEEGPAPVDITAGGYPNGDKNCLWH
jgi:hypothetical protein